jgi:hypothetical protein
VAPGAHVFTGQNPQGGIKSSDRHSCVSFSAKSELPSGMLTLRLARRLKSIEKLSPGQQKVLLQNIDMFLKGAKQV